MTEALFQAAFPFARAEGERLAPLPGSVRAALSGTRSSGEHAGPEPAYGRFGALWPELTPMFTTLPMAVAVDFAIVRPPR